MAYVEARTKAGKTIEVERYYTPRHYARGERRRKKEAVTRAEQRRVNSRMAVKKLRRLINANFGYGDWHLDMGYVRRPEEETVTKEQMREDASKFLRKVRQIYKKAGQLLKYIHVMEVGERGARHHHMVINKVPGIDTAEIQKCWNAVYAGKSFIHFSPLDKSGNYARLAEYLVKYTDRTIGTEEALQGKRWNASRNLIRPETVKRVISKYDVLREPNRVSGYFIDKKSVERGNYAPEYGGFDFLRFILVRLE